MKHLCSAEATPAHADSIIMVLLKHLRDADTDSSAALHSAVIEEMRKRRTKLSTLLQYLLRPDYDFELETTLG